MMNIGDPVTIIENLDVDEYEGLWVTPQMLRFAGKSATIEGKRGNCYLLDVDKHVFLWPESILKPRNVTEEQLLLERFAKFTTKEIVQVLRKRQGIQSIEIATYESIELLIDDKTYPLDIGSKGPATILVVND